MHGNDMNRPAPGMTHRPSVETDRKKGEGPMRRNRGLNNLKRQVLMMSVGVFACEAGTLAGAQEIKVGGAGPAIGTMRMLADEYNRTHERPKVTVLAASLGSAGGVR